MYHVSGWKPNEKKGGWLAETALNGEIYVRDEDAALVEFVSNSTDFVAAMMHCMDFGQLGTGAANKQERAKVNEVIVGATHHHSKQVTVLNGVRFEVEPQELMESVVLMCVLSPKMES